ncbi:TRAP transporter substrate-binding protein [Prosthecomicrobium sp. N25]
MKVVGGLAGIRQYSEFEEPFWRVEMPARTDGRVRAIIHPFDGSGLRGQEMLQLMRLGVVPFGTAILSMAAADEPELAMADLPALNPDLESLRTTVSLYRPRLKRLLAERYGIELLGVYTYPAQVLYCTGAFDGLGDLAGRRIRTSSAAQSDMMAALGAVPVILPFAEIVPSLRRKVVDCAVTGTLSGNEIGLYEATSHIHAMAISWGLSIFGANLSAWDGLPPDVRGAVRSGVEELERRIWAAAESDTTLGFACNAGWPSCTTARRGRMTIVPGRATDDEKRRRLLQDTVLPRWIDRCGADCVQAWNETLALNSGIRVWLDRASDAARTEPVRLRSELPRVP